MTADTHPFDLLTPDFVLDAVDRRGLVTDGRLLALNSYENRVYQVGLEDGPPVIAKFYRPERWSTEQILEEHAFSFELEEAELPVVPPLRDGEGRTLGEQGPFRFALFERRGGHALESDNDSHLEAMGRWLARLHNIGSTRRFQSRPVLDSQSYGHDAVAFLLENFVPPDLRVPYETLARDLLQAVDELFQSVPQVRRIRVHGDCHVGNIL